MVVDNRKARKYYVKMRFCIYLIREQCAARWHRQYVEHRRTDNSAYSQITFRHEGTNDVDEQFRTRTRSCHYGRAGHILGDVKLCRDISFRFIWQRDTAAGEKVEQTLWVKVIEGEATWHAKMHCLMLVTMLQNVEREATVKRQYLHKKTMHFWDNPFGVPIVLTHANFFNRGNEIVVTDNGK